jgi:hypothetical protein
VAPLGNAALHLIPYALVAAASPLGLAATLTVMRAGRPSAVAFVVGALAGQLLTCGVLVVIGTVAVGGHPTEHPRLRTGLELALGLALLVLALVVHRRPESSEPEEGPRGRALLDRLTEVHAPTAAAVGVLLGIGGPKRLVLAALAATSITAAGLDGTQEAALVLWYGLLATVVAWAPVAAYLILGTSVVDRVDAGFDRLMRHRRSVTVWSLVVVGGFLTVDALVLL